MEYLILKASDLLTFSTDWEAGAWRDVPVVEVACFRPESSGHRPRTSVKLLHDGAGIHGIFRVEDRYVRCVRTRYFDEVWKDSCVELFAQPRPDRGYFNFEFNCGGAFLCSYITNPERVPAGFKEFVRIPADLGRQIRVAASLPPTTDPEIPERVTWTLRFFVPFSLVEHYVGTLTPLSGQRWRGNFYKCAEDNSHPHWASWAPVDEFNFHRPSCFETLRFD